VPPTTATAAACSFRRRLALTLALVCLVAPLQIQNNLPTYILLGLAVAVVPWAFVIDLQTHPTPLPQQTATANVNVGGVLYTIHPINYLLGTVFFFFVSLPPPSRCLVILSVGQVRWVLPSSCGRTAPMM
jgi:hypothetical protein